MKTLASVLLAILGLASQVHSQDKTANDSPESLIVPTASNATARILGPIQDGTPAPPAPPKPEFIVPRKNILEATTQEQGGRTITIQRIKPIALPPPPETTTALPPLDDKTFRSRLAEHPQLQMVSLGATVYRSKDFPPRTFVTYRPGNEEEPVTFWSSADFSLLAGIQKFIGSDGQTCSLLLMWSVVDMDHWAASLKQHGRAYSAPNIPEFTEGKATFAIVGNPPAAEALVPIQSLHDLYNNEYLRLKTAYEGRERARIQREAELKANPPQPKDITLNYWRTEKPAAQGGAR